MAFFPALFGRMWETSPGRERRETWFADDGRKRKGKGTEGRESQDQQAPATPESADVVAQMSQDVLEKVSGIHNLDERMDKIVGSKELAELAEFEAGSGTAQDAFMRETLDDPERTTFLIRKLDDRIEDSRLFADALESRLKLEGGDELKPLREEDRAALLEALRSLREHVTAHVPATDIALLFSGTPRSIDSLTTDPTVAGILKENPTDSWAIGQALRLEERVTDENERYAILHTLVAAMNALTKKQNYGLTKRENGVSEDWTAWRRDFVGELEEQSAALKERLKAQLEKKADAFYAAEEQREDVLFRSLKLKPEDLDGNMNDEQMTIVERACLVTRGVHFSIAHDALLQRGDAVRQMIEKIQGANPENVCDRSAALLDMMKEFEKENDRFDPENTSAFLAEQRVEQATAEQWAVWVGRRLQEDPQARGQMETIADLFVAPDKPWHTTEEFLRQFKEYADADDPSALRADYPRCIDAQLFNLRMREKINFALSAENVMPIGLETKAKQMQENMDNASAPTAEELFDPTTEKPRQIVTDVRTRLHSLLETMQPALDAPVCHVLQIPQKLAERWKRIDTGFALAASYANQVQRGDEPQEELRTKMIQEWKHAQEQMKQLEQAKGKINALATNIVEEDSIPHGETGFFDFADRKIHILRSLTGSKREEKIAHERGHGILHILRQEVLPVLLLSETEAAISKERTAGGEGFDALLERLADYYHIDDPDMQEGLRQSANKDFPSDAALAEQRVRELRREHLLEELFSRYADWTGRGRQTPALSADDPHREAKEAQRDLFEMLHGKLGSPEKTATPKTHMPSKGRMYTDDSGEEETPTTDVTAAASDIPESDNASLLKLSLATIGNNLRIIRSFLNAYKESTHAGVRAYIDENSHQFATLDNQYREYEAFFKGQVPEGQPPPVLPPEQDPIFRGNVEKLKGDSSDIIDTLRKFDNEFLDIRWEQPEEHRAFWQNIEYVSILDLVKLWKDFKEDMKTIYTRNQQRRLDPVGKSIYKAIASASPYVPYLGKRYLEKLPGYHERRYAGAELESVGNWKKAMEKVDTHDILHILGSSRNLDQIRGCIELICDRGEMDWNDTGVWKTLMGITHYKMPIEACLRDDILRDTWLRRMISETWNDKELYYKWRSTNDSNTESQKKKYIQTVDQYSNVRGGLAGNLERQLKLYNEWKDKTAERKRVGLGPAKFPDDVKPHLFEEVLEYSIKNGKMAMEEKLFYLVQGVASGLLPIERLRAMAGQHGSIINLFPQIEYFYAHNNSLPEIKELADRLKEFDDKGKPTYKPGLKTTLWFHFDVSRDEAVRKRLSKGSTRKAEEIDHEDIPFTVTQMDYNEMSNMLDVISGGRQKVTPEGWKNAYVGFNSKMKIFGSLARLERDHLDRFTTEDAGALAQNLAAFIFMDNALTLNGKTDKGRVPTLALSQFHTKAISGVEGNSAWEYRKRMTDFIRMLDKAGIFNDVKWGKLSEDEKDLKKLGVTKKEMLAVDLDANDKNDGYQRNPEGVKILSEVVFSKFAQQLEAAIKQNMGTFKNVLIRQEENFLNEGGSPTLNYDEVLKIRKGQQQTRQ